jgi:UDP-N-acetylmuramyl tripeptide synthase
MRWRRARRRWCWKASHRPSWRSRARSPSFRTRAAALGFIARNRYRAAAALHLSGVTGTNGKTTTTYIVEAMLRAGRAVGRASSDRFRTGVLACRVGRGRAEHDARGAHVA